LRNGAAMPPEQILLIAIAIGIVAVVLIALDRNDRKH
jgi:hypothetical protein